MGSLFPPEGERGCYQPKCDRVMLAISALAQGTWPAYESFNLPDTQKQTWDDLFTEIQRLYAIEDRYKELLPDGELKMESKPPERLIAFDIDRS